MSTPEWTEETRKRFEEKAAHSRRSGVGIPISGDDLKAALAEIDRLTAEVERLKARVDEEEGNYVEMLEKRDVQFRRAEAAEALAERERARADDHDSARQSEKERADYAETKLAEAIPEDVMMRNTELAAELAEAQAKLDEIELAEVTERWLRQVAEARLFEASSDRMKLRAELAAARDSHQQALEVLAQALSGMSKRDVDLAAARERITSLESSWEGSDQYRAVKEALDRQTAAEDALSAAREENYRLAAEHTQCHDWNGRLVHEHYELREQVRVLREALDSIVVRCTEGDKRVDWLPTIVRIARAALRSTEEPKLEHDPAEMGWHRCSHGEWMPPGMSCELKPAAEEGKP